MNLRERWPDFEPDRKQAIARAMVRVEVLSMNGRRSRAFDPTSIRVTPAPQLNLQLLTQPLFEVLRHILISQKREPGDGPSKQIPADRFNRINDFVTGGIGWQEPDLIDGL
ncbi:MAG: hypothetical protein ACKOW5_13830 [Actinomycetales bacterium]